MAWEDVGGKVPNDPLLASDWNKLYGNFEGHANGDSGAPVHDIEGAGITTTSTDTRGIVSPDGSGGLTVRQERARVGQYIFRENPAADTTVTSDVYPLGMEDQGQSVDVDPYGTASTGLGSGSGNVVGVRMSTNGGNAGYINAGIFSMRHDGGSPGNIILGMTVEQAGGFQRIVNTTVPADDTWQTVLFLDAAGGNQMWFELKSSGGSTQFRMRSADIVSDPYFYEVSMLFTIYDV